LRNEHRVFEVGEVVIYTDGACEPKNPGGVPTYGFVIYRDGMKLAEESGLAGEPYSKEASNNVAEYVALIKALEKAQALSLEDRDIEIVSDSRLLVMQMKGEFAVKAPRLLPHHKRAKEILTHFKNASFRWVPREQNEEADYLSKTAYETYLSSH
jgi:ribonuclease HI